MADVYEAFEATNWLKRRIALKILREDVPQALIDLEMRNLELLQKVNHPSIVEVFSVEPQHRCICMELLTGLTLKERLDRCGRIDSPIEAWRIAYEILEAVSKVHDSKLQHKDIKTSNISLSPRNGSPERAILFDFGVSTGPGDDQTHGSSFSVPRDNKLDANLSNEIRWRKDDLYAVGRVIYQMLNGPGEPHPEELVQLPTGHVEIANLVPWLCGRDRPDDAKIVLERLKSAHHRLVSSIREIAQKSVKICRDLTFQLMDSEENRSLALVRHNLRCTESGATLLNEERVTPQKDAELSRQMGNLLYCLTVGNVPATEQGFAEYAAERKVSLPSELLVVVEQLNSPNVRHRPQTLEELDDVLYRLQRTLGDPG